MGTDDLLATVDALAWGEYEVERMTPADEKQPKIPESSQVRKVENSPNPQPQKNVGSEGSVVTGSSVGGWWGARS